MKIQSLELYMSKAKIVVISDIHFGKKDPKITYNMLKDVFIKYCRDNKPDLIVIAGDLFDKKFGLHSDVTENANKFVSDLVSFCDENDTDLYMIHGTMSHDNMQLKSFNHYSENKHVHIFKEKTFVQFKGLNIYIMPEEYVPFSYYNKDLMCNPDLIFGHGMFDFATVVVKTDKKQRSENLNSKIISQHVKYGAYFGHVHTHKCNGKVKYTGSFDRLAFGEEEDKGFMVIDINGDEFSDKFIINSEAQTYKSVNATEIPDTMEETIKYLNDMSQTVNFLRIVIDSDIKEDKFNNIVGFTRTHDNVSILKKVINSKREVDEQTRIKNKELEDSLKEFENLDFIEITKKIGKEKYGVDFTTDEILEIMEKDIKR